VFLAPWSRSRFKKKPGAGARAAWEKSQEPEPLEKKVRKNLPAPQPCSDNLTIKETMNQNQEQRKSKV